MRAIFTQTGPGLSIEQGGLGPIVTLGFGATGAPASIGTAPALSASSPTDMVLVQRGGGLGKLPIALFGGLGASTAYGNGQPAAGSGMPGQSYIDLSAHAQWLNFAGTWTQIGFLGAPTAAPIPPGGQIALPIIDFSKEAYAFYVAAIS